MRLCIGHRIRLFIIAIACGLSLASANADVWTAPASDLANKIAAKAGPGSAISIKFANRSSLSASESTKITAQIRSQLQGRGMRMVEPAQAVANISVTLSENEQNYLWIADIAQGSTSEVVMVPMSRSSPADQRGASALTLRRRLLLTSDDPILDVALQGDTAVVLTPSALTYYRAQNGNFQELLSMPIKHSRPFPRDVRGHITGLAGSAIEAWLPGVRCIHANPQQAVLECQDTDDPWPLSTPGVPIGVNAFFSPVRNFFSGAMTFHDEAPSAQARDHSHDLPPFYSMAVVEEEALPLWILAGVDGRTTFFGGKRGTQPTHVNLRGLGSDLASIVAPCGPQRLLLATRNTDFNQQDSVQPFHIVNRDVIAAGNAIDFPGPITALWTSSAASDSATAVSHNLNTGKYEAYSLSLVCNQ